MNPGADPEDMVSVRVWLQANRIITSRRRRLMAIQELRDGIEAGQAPKTSGEFLIRLTERLAGRIGAVVDDIEEQADRLEETLEANAARTSPTAVSTLRQQAAAIRRYLAPQRDALDRLYRDPGMILSTEEAQELREQADRMTRYLEDLDLARERAVVLREEYMSRLAHEQNARIYLLSVVAAIFLPLSFLTGLFGMNVAGLPGTDNPAGFIITATTMLLLGIGLVAFFKWKGWI
jgi:zinc transporter